MELVEQEIQNVKNRQDRELAMVRDKDKKIEELELLLDECKNNLIKKRDIQKELEEQLHNMEYQFTKVLADKDKIITDQRRKLSESDEEMKVLIAEIERQKKMAKENIAKLNQLFK